MSEKFDHPASRHQRAQKEEEYSAHQRSLSASKLIFRRDFFMSSKDLDKTKEKKSECSLVRHAQTQNSMMWPSMPIPSTSPKRISLGLNFRSQTSLARVSTNSIHCINPAGDCEPFPDMGDLEEELETPKRSYSTSKSQEIFFRKESVRKGKGSFSEDSKQREEISPKKCGHFQDLREIGESHKIAAEPSQEDKEIERICKALADNERYKTVKKKKYRMYHRKEPNKTITLKFEGELEIELKNLFKLLYETQIYHLWFPNCRRATLLHSFNMQKRMLKSELMTPGLMADRQNIMLSMFVDRLKSKGCIYVLARSIHHLQEIDGVPVPKLTKGKVKLDVQFFGFQIEPTSRTSAIVRSVFNFCPNVKFVPLWVLNMVNKHFGKMLFERMIKYSLSLKGTKIEKKLAKKEESQFYDWINSQLLQHYDRKGWWAF